MNTIKEIADHIKMRIDEIDHDLKLRRYETGSYAYAYGRMIVEARHAVACLRMIDPAYGLEAAESDRIPLLPFIGVDRRQTTEAQAGRELTRLGIEDRRRYTRQQT